jgi:hypothetical protein
MKITLQEINRTDHVGSAQRRIHRTGDSADFLDQLAETIYRNCQKAFLFRNHLRRGCLFCFLLDEKKH